MPQGLYAITYVDYAPIEGQGKHQPMSQEVVTAN